MEKSNNVGIEKSFRNKILQRLGEKTICGNISLINELKNENDSLSEDEIKYYYEKIKNKLLEEGKIVLGKGRGGSIIYIEKVKNNKENDLYPIVKEYLEKNWLDPDQKSFILQTANNKGGKKRIGKWSRPDFILVKFNNYKILPNKSIEIISFEVKTQSGIKVDSVYEANAHSIFCNRVYLVLQITEILKESKNFAEVQNHCIHHGIGLITFSSTDNIESFEEVLEAEYKNPELEKMDEFLLALPQERQETIKSWLR